jgi:signal peptidase I
MRRGRQAIPPHHSLMRPRHTRKLISGALGLIALVCLWVYLAPVGVGGSTSYVVTEGISMKPRFHAGDLVLVRSQDNYHVGEIVAYHSLVFHTVVLHRIVARDGARYVFKGDNNNFLDFEHPTRSQLIGSLWLHVPGAGASLHSLRSPALIGILMAVGTLFFAGAAFTRRRRRRRAAARDQPRPQRGSAEPVLGIAAIAAVPLLPFVALAALAFTRPATAPLPFTAAYRQSGAFSYSADATPGPAYAGNRALTGEPLFTHVIHTVKFQFGYSFAAAAAHSVTGTAALYATITSTSGWHTTVALSHPTRFHGDHALIAANLDLASLVSLIHSVEATTGVGGSYTLTVLGRVRAHGRLDALALRAPFSPKVQFAVNQQEVQPLAAGQAVGGAEPSAQFTPSAAGSVKGMRPQPVYLSLKFARLSVATARWIALAAIAILIGALLAIVALVRPRVRNESAAILARYGRLIVAVEFVSQPPGVAVIDVADMESLVKIAEHYDRSILHQTAGESEAFWVTDESGHFRYTVGAAVADAETVLMEWAPKDEGLDYELVPAEEEILPADEGLMRADEGLVAYEQVDEDGIDRLASEVYADELEFGGAISASEAQPAAQEAGAVPDAAEASAASALLGSWGLS